MNSSDKPISYPYAYGRLSASIMDLPNKLAIEASKEGIDLDPKIRIILLNLITQLDSKTRAAAAAEYERNGFLN